MEVDVGILEPSQHTCHDHPFAGHMGRDRTLTLVRRYFYWPGLASYVAEYVKRCPICQLANPFQSGRKPK